jgi:hypothetical protein
MRERMNARLRIDPAKTAVLAIDTHRGHLDPDIATMPVAADVAADVVESSRRLLEATRAAGIASRRTGRASRRNCRRRSRATTWSARRRPR